VITGGGAIAEHDPPGQRHEVKNVTYVDGQFLVELSLTSWLGPHRVTERQSEAPREARSTNSASRRRSTAA
jgi:hypothetical protein